MVESHLGGVGFRRVEPDADGLYCSQCGGVDRVSGPVDLADPDMVVDAACDLSYMLCEYPMPWEDVRAWFDAAGYALRRIADASPEPVDVLMLGRRLRARVRAWWTVHGFRPFDRRRNIAYWMMDTLRRLDGDGCDRMTAARRLVDVDWGDRMVSGPDTPVPWLGCLLAGRERVLSEYRGVWLDLMDAHPGWRMMAGPCSCVCAGAGDYAYGI